MLIVAKELVKIAGVLLGKEFFAKKSKELTPEEKTRRTKKVNSLRTMAENITSLRRRITKDLESDDEKVKLTALVVKIMDETAERVGNEASMKEGHVGVTGFQKKHITIDGSTVKLKYVGKSGVKQEKQLTDETVAKMLKECLERASKDSDCVFSTSDGFKIKAAQVNRFLDEFGVTAKDIRGYAANRLIVEALKGSEKSSDEEERAKRFREVIKSVAAKVGHGAGTLRKHYILPNIENDYVKNGKIDNIKDACDRLGAVKRKLKRNGDCYEAAGKYIMDHRGDDLYLVHGEVTGQGPIAGLKYGHAWVEDGETVIDVSNGRDIQMPKVLYYALGHIERVQRYDVKDAIEHLLKWKVYGPWEFKTETGL